MRCNRRLGDGGRQAVERLAWRAHGAHAHRLAPVAVEQDIDDVAGHVEARDRLRDDLERCLHFLGHGDGRALTHGRLGFRLVAHAQDDRDRLVDRADRGQRACRGVRIAQHSHHRLGPFDSRRAQRVLVRSVAVEDRLAILARLPHRGTIQIEDDIGRCQLPQRASEQLPAHPETEDHDVIRKMSGLRAGLLRMRGLRLRRQPRSDRRRNPQQRRRDGHRRDARGEQQLPLRRIQQAHVEAGPAEDERKLTHLRQVDSCRRRHAHGRRGGQKCPGRDRCLDEDEQRRDRDDRAGTAAAAPMDRRASPTR